jgi:hypothetical protein
MAARRSGVCAVDFLVDLMAIKPAAGAEPRRDSPDKGLTLPSRHGQPEPRLPHERDESTDSHPGTEDERIKQAARDLADGQEDTGRTPVVTELTRQEFPSQTEKKINP